MSSKKTVRFSKKLSFNDDVTPQISPDTPMVLRSRCQGGNCECEDIGLWSKTGRTPLSNYHHRHHHHVVNSSPKITTTGTTSPSILKHSGVVSTAESVVVNSETVQTIHMKETDINVSEIKNHQTTKLTSGRHENDDILDYNDLNTARGGSSSSSKVNGGGLREERFSALNFGKSAFVKLKRLSQDKFATTTSNSRVLYHSSDYSSGFDDSDTEDSPKTDYTYSQSRSYTSRETPSRDRISPNMSRTRLRRSGEYSSDEELSYLLKEQKTKGSVLKNRRYSDLFFSSNGDDIISSTPLNYNGYNEFNNNYQGLGQNLQSSTSFETKSSFLYKIYSFLVLGLFRTLRSVGLTIFRWCYQIITMFLIADVWVLVQIRKRPYLLLLFLLLPLLFWMFGGSDKESVIYNNIPATVATSASSYLSILTGWFDFKPFDQWSSGGFLGGGGGGSDEELYSKVETAGSQIDIGQLRLMLKEMVSQESKSTMETFASQRDEQLQRILLELKSKNEATTQQEMNLKNLVSQSNLLSEELVTIKAAIAKTSAATHETNNDPPTEAHFEFLRTKLNQVEAKLDSLQTEIAAQKNCCKNQTTSTDITNKQLINLMFDIFNVTNNGNGHERLGLTRLRESIAKLFSDQNNFNARMDQIDQFLATELNAKMQKIANKEAVVIASEKVNGLRAEFKYNENKRTENVMQESSTTSAASSAFGLNDNRTNKCTSADDVQKIVKQALFIYDSDKTGRVDYALESSGGSVISIRCSETYPIGTGQYRVFGVPIWSWSNSPRIAIQPEVHPGQCWAFKGTHGYLVIQLASAIRPTAFTMEHVHKSLSPTGNIDSAPKDFAVFGLKAEDDFEGKLLGRYRFEDNGESLQDFIVQDPNPGIFPIIELRINSNHGNNDYTCLYRFRVHGVRV